MHLPWPSPLTSRAGQTLLHPHWPWTYIYYVQFSSPQTVPRAKWASGLICRSVCLSTYLLDHELPNHSVFYPCLCPQQVVQYLDRSNRWSIMSNWRGGSSIVAQEKDVLVLDVKHGWMVSSLGWSTVSFLPFLGDCPSGRLSCGWVKTSSLYWLEGKRGKISAKYQVSSRWCFPLCPWETIPVRNMPSGCHEGKA